MTPLLPVFSNDDLSPDAVLQLGHMRNDADQPLSTLGQSLHGVHCLVQGVLIQRAEALIGIANPIFRDKLIAQAEKQGIWRAFSKY